MLTADSSPTAADSLRMTVARVSRQRPLLKREARKSPVSAGVNEAAVQQLAGHTSIAITLRYYTGIMPEALRAAQVQLPYVDMVNDVSDTYHEALKLVRRKSA